MSDIATLTGLALLRAPFPPHQISKLPKGTKAQNECPYDQKRGCNVCAGFHHPDIKHLDYVGHAALTDRLLDADQAWTWEPLAMSADGLPVMDHLGGMWIRLTVCGVTRLGYGHPDGKEGGNAIKEVIGDAMRNAAMRFGAALELWHKGDLHLDPPAAMSANVLADWVAHIESSATTGEARTRAADAEAACNEIGDTQALAKVQAVAAAMAAKARAKATKTPAFPPATADIGDGDNHGVGT